MLITTGGVLIRTTVKSIRESGGQRRGHADQPGRRRELSGLGASMSRKWNRARAIRGELI